MRNKLCRLREFPDPHSVPTIVKVMANIATVYMQRMITGQSMVIQDLWRLYSTRDSRPRPARRSGMQILARAAERRGLDCLASVSSQYAFMLLCEEQLIPPAINTSTSHQQ